MRDAEQVFSPSRNGVFVKTFGKCDKGLRRRRRRRSLVQVVVKLLS